MSFCHQAEAMEAGSIGRLQHWTGSFAHGQIPKQRRKIASIEGHSNEGIHISKQKLQIQNFVNTVDCMFMLHALICDARVLCSIWSGHLKFWKSFAKFERQNYWSIFKTSFLVSLIPQARTISWFDMAYFLKLLTYNFSEYFVTDSDVGK